MKNKFLLISIPSLIILLLVGVLLFDYSEQKRSVRHLMTRANLLSEQLSKVNNIPPSRSFCESGEYRRLRDNYLDLSRDLDELADRWVSADKVTLQNIVSRIRGYTEDLSVKCTQN
jgi:hypothetical protein